MEEIDKEIKLLEKEVEDIIKSKETLIQKLERKIDSLKEHKKEIIKSTNKIYLQKLEEFEKQPTDEKMYELLKLLRGCYIKDIVSLDEVDKITKKSRLLFDYIYAKQDIELIEQYLLAKMSYESSETFDEDILKYQLHLTLKDGAYEFTDRSKHILGYGISAYEIQEFMRMLGELDYKKRSEDSKEIYRSEDFEKYKMRAIAGAYGRYLKYVYYDGEYGHKDYERSCLDEIHDKAFLEQEKLKTIEL